MGLTSFPNGISTSHIVSAETTGSTGDVYFVCNASAATPRPAVGGSNGNSGTSSTTPFASLAYAITRCTANRGDTIYVMPGHVESVSSAGALNLNKAGVKIVFLGEGSNRATIQFDTAVTASMTITNNVRLVNPRFKAGIDALTGPISVGSSTDITFENVEYHDDTNKNTIAALVGTTCHRLKINGWKFYKSNEGGTQKASHLKIGAAGDVELHDIDINGDFSDAPIYNTTAWARVRLEKFTLNNTNSGPALGIKLAAASAGVAKDGNVRVASGVLFVSAVNQMNWRDVYGVNADGEYQSYQIGDVTDYAHDPAIGANTSNNLFDSSNTTSNRDGSVLERLEDIRENIDAEGGLVFVGVTDSGMVASTTSIVCDDMAGKGNDFFNNKYYMQVILNSNAAGTAPETQVRQITDYVSSTGTFTVTAFGANVEAGDSIVVLHESLVTLGRNDADNTIDTSSIVSNATGSVLERLQTIQEHVGATDSATNILGANDADNGFNSGAVVANADGSIIERDQYNQEAIAAVQTDLGNPSARTNFQSIETMIGIPDAVNSNLDDILRTGFDSTAILPNANGSLMEIAKSLSSAGSADNGLFFTGTCDAGMVASTTSIVSAELSGFGNTFFAGTPTTYYMQVLKAGAVAPEGEIRAITAYTSATGTFTTNAFSVNVEANDEVLIVHHMVYDTYVASVTTIPGLIGSPAGASVSADIAAIKTVVDDIKTDSDTIEDVSLAATPAAGSLSTFISTGGVALGTALPNSTSLYDTVKNVTIVGVTSAPVANTLSDTLHKDGAFAYDNTTDSLEAISDKVTDVNTDIGNPSARTNLQSIEAMLGNPDAATKTIYGNIGDFAGDTNLQTLKAALGVPDVAAKPLYTCLITDRLDNATYGLSALDTKIGVIDGNADKIDSAALSVSPTVGSVANKLNISEGLTYRGSCDSGMVASTTSIVVPDLAGLGNDYFNNKYYLEVIKNSNAVGTNPEGFTRQITDYDSASGTFTTAAFPANVEANDVVLIKHDSLAIIDSVTYDSTAITAATNGSLMEVAKYIVGEVNRISAASLAVAPVAGSIGRFLASGGTALGSELPDSRSLYDMVCEYGEGLKINKSYADLTGYDTAAAFTVTGDVQLKIFGVVGGTGITSTSGITTLQVGTTADPDVCLPATTIDNSDFAAGDVWVDNNPEDDAAAISATPWVVVSNGADIIMTRSVDDITAGSLTLYCFWKPLSAGATVTPA